MLLAEAQKHFELLVFALVLLGRAHVLFHLQNPLLKLGVFRFQRLVAENVVVVPLGLPVNGGDAGADWGENRPHDLFAERRPARNAENDGHDDGQNDRNNQNRLEPRRPEISFQSITSPR